MIDEDQLSSLGRTVRDALVLASVEVRARYQSRDFEIYTKSDQSPLTEADLAANRILREHLLATPAGVSWLSEESPDKQDRLENDFVWVVDPIDGTRDFVDGTSEFSISVGLSYRGAPIIGGVAMPGEDRLVYGYGDSLFMVKLSATEPGGAPDSMIAEEKRIEFPRDHADSEARARIVVSGSEWRAGAFRPFEDVWKMHPEGSIARKLAIVAIGEADAVVSMRSKNEWDICGGHALLRAAGLVMRSIEPMEEQSYNNAETKSLGLLAGRAELVEALHATLLRKGERPKSY